MRPSSTRKGVAALELPADEVGGLGQGGTRLVSRSTKRDLGDPVGEHERELASLDAGSCFRHAPSAAVNASTSAIAGLSSDGWTRPGGSATTARARSAVPPPAARSTTTPAIARDVTSTASGG